jgi:phospholipid/cholesterol/gamma-HCH transport system ATP-binding protein
MSEALSQENSPFYIQIQDLHKSFGKQEVVKGVSLAVKRGETLVIIGRSGEGKSVLLKLILGLLRADSGSVRVDGQEVTKLPERKLGPVRRKLGMLFQDGALFDSLNVARNVAFPLFEAGLRDRKEVLRRVKEALAQVELEEHLAKMPVNLSGGMRKRVSLARAVVSKPECVLYDEPTSGLDPVVADSIIYLIAKMKEVHHLTSVVVTHDMKCAYQVGDRIALLREGKIYFLGTPCELKGNPDPVVQDFIQGRSQPRQVLRV